MLTCLKEVVMVVLEVRVRDKSQFLMPREKNEISNERKSEVQPTFQACQKGSKPKIVRANFKRSRGNRRGVLLLLVLTRLGEGRRRQQLLPSSLEGIQTDTVQDNVRDDSSVHIHTQREREGGREIRPG